MAPINIPEHVAQGPTLTMASPQPSEYSTHEDTKTPWIFWVMVTLVGTLVISLFGSIFFLLAKRLVVRISGTVVYYANAFKPIGALSKFIDSIKRSVRVLTASRLYTKSSKSEAILPTSLDPYTSRPVILPNLKVSLALPTRSFGLNVREKVHDIQCGLLRKSEDRMETREIRGQAIAATGVTTSLQASSKEIRGPRSPRNRQEPRIPSWMRWFIKWKPEQKLQVPEIKLWGPDEEPPSNDEQQQARRYTIDYSCTTKELMEHYGIDDAALAAICSKPWQIYQYEPLAGKKQTDGKDERKGDEAKPDAREIDRLGVDGSHLTPPHESVALHTEQSPDGDCSSCHSDSSDDSSILDTPPMSPDSPSSAFPNDGSSVYSSSPTTPGAGAFDDAICAVPEIRIIEPTSPDRIKDVYNLPVASIYSFQPPSPPESTSSPILAFDHCSPTITSIVDDYNSPFDTPPLSPAPIPINLSPTLSPASYLQLPMDMSRASRKRAKVASDLANKGTMFNLAKLPNRRPLIFSAGEGGVAQNVGIGREGVKKTKDKRRSGLGLSGMPLGGIQEIEESEEDDEQVTVRANEHARPSTIPAQETDTGYLATDGTAIGCDRSLDIFAPEPPLRQSNEVEHRTLDHRSVTTTVRTSASSRRAPSLPFKLSGPRPRFSSSRTLSSNSPSPDKSKSNRVASSPTEAQKTKNAGSLKRSSSTPLRKLTNNLFFRTDTESPIMPMESPDPSTPPLPSRRFPLRSSSLTFTSHMTRSPSILRSAAKTVISATSRSPPSQSISTPQSSPPSRTRSRKILTKPPVPRYRPSDT